MSDARGADGPERHNTGAHKGSRDESGLLRLGDLLEQTAQSAAGIDQAGREGGCIARSLAESWPGIVGAEAASNTRPIQLNRGRLVVSTSSPAWAQSMQFMVEDIRERLNAALADACPGVSEGEPVKSVFFRHAGWERVEDHSFPATASGKAELMAQRAECAQEAPLQPAPETRPEFTPEQQDALAAVDELDIPAELKESMRRAMRAAFVRDGRD